MNREKNEGSASGEDKQNITIVTQRYDYLQYVPFKSGDIIPPKYKGNPLAWCLDEGDIIWGVYKHLVPNEYYIGAGEIENGWL